MGAPQVDLTALGLAPLVATVLACVAEESYTTAVAVAARLGVSRSQVSDAVDVLLELGLVDRARGRRPAPVWLHEQVEAAVTARLDELAARRQADADGAAAAAAHVQRAATLRASRPAPTYYLDPAGPPPNWRLARATTSYEEVCRPGGTTLAFGAPFAARHRYRRRVLVLGDAPADRAAWMRERGVEVRTTTARLPVLLLVDRAHARVEVSEGGRAARTAWTHDPAQVAALSRLFDLWWDEAGG